MMTVTDGLLTHSRYGRVIVIQQLTDHDRFLALIGAGVRESIAMALVANLITTKRSKQPWATTTISH
jgi:hypothetical protein